MLRILLFCEHLQEPGADLLSASEAFLMLRHFARTAAAGRITPKPYSNY